MEAEAFEGQETNGKTDPVIRAGTLIDSARNTTEKKDNQLTNEKKPEETKDAAKESVEKGQSKQAVQGEPLQTNESQAS